MFRFESKGTDFDHPFYLVYGEQRSSRLYKSAPLLPVGIHQVEMANYVEQLYHDFVYGRLMEDFGKSLANDWMPRPELTDSVVHSMVSSLGTLMLKKCWLMNMMPGTIVRQCL